LFIEMGLILKLRPLFEFYNEKEKKHVDQEEYHQCFHFTNVAGRVNPLPNATSRR